MRIVFLYSALLSLLLPGRASAQEARLGLVSAASSAPASEALETLQACLQREGLAILPQAQLLKKIRQVDLGARVAERAAARLNEGKKLHLGMELDQAAARYREAIDILQGGFVSHYDHNLLAEPWLQLGVALFESGKKEEAEDAFRRAARLIPGLQMSSGYFSPRVREAYTQAVSGLGAERAELLSPAEAARLCRAVGLLGMLVMAEDRLGQRTVLQVGLFDSVTQAYRQLESAVLEESPAETGRQLAERLLSASAQVAGVELKQPQEEAADAGTVAAADAGTVEGEQAGRSATLPGGSDAGGEELPPPTPWYWRHWWIWPVAAALVGAAVALPLTAFRRDVVDIHVR